MPASHIRKDDVMININIQLFSSITFCECINSKITSDKDAEKDANIKRTVDQVLNRTRHNKDFYKMSEKEKIEYLLKHVLIQIIPKWNIDIDDKETYDIYLKIKRHYFLATDNFYE